ncbi:MAG TPA: hypothetical protein VG779_12860 [Actinomycetota bacterium]|jgi:hypothetical protein|nr:hypothetical protein [Actinomycetota bacterium]
MATSPKLGLMPQIINGGKWAENRLRHLRELREQTSNEDQLRLIDQEIEQLKAETGFGRRLLRHLLPGMK